MKKIYKKDETCMEFTNEEVILCLVEPLRDHDNLEIEVIYEQFNNTSLEKTPDFLKEKSNLGEIIEHNDFMRQKMKGEKVIDYINLDGNNDGFNVMFFGHMIAIFFKNEEFMFIDDLYRKMQTTSETQGNVVYEGELRCLTHKEILELIRKFVILLTDSKKITVNEEKQDDRGLQYPKCNYEIELIKDVVEPEEVQIENITFLIKNS